MDRAAACDRGDDQSADAARGDGAGGTPPKPRLDFERALEIARAQQARSWELVVATVSRDCWRVSGRRAEAHDLLAPVYGWFTEGFETLDLKEAKALLKELA